MTRGIYMFIIYNFLQLYCLPYDNEMDNVEVSDAHDNDDHYHSQYEHNEQYNIYNMNTLNNKTKLGAMILNFVSGRYTT